MPESEAKRDEGLFAKLPDWKSESILLAATPVASYFIAYSFERGYGDCFAVPDYLQDVTLTTIFTVIILLIIAYVGLYSFGSQFLLPLLRWLYPKLFLFYTYILCIAALSALFSWKYGIVVVLLGVFFFVLDAIQATMNKDKHEGPWLKRLAFRRDSLTRPRKKIEEVRADLPDKFTCFVTSVFAIWFLSYSLGSAFAHWQDTYYVSSATPSLLLINVKDGKAICSEYDPKTRTILYHLVIVPLKEDEISSFALRKIGFLTFPTFSRPYHRHSL